MHAFRFACLALVSSAVAAAEPGPTPRSSTLLHGRTCEGALAKFKPGQPPKLQKLDRLPPAEVYAAVYYSNGCPAQLVEAQGRRR